MSSSYHPADTVLIPEHDLTLVESIGEPEVMGTLTTWLHDGDSNTGFNLSVDDTGPDGSGVHRTQNIRTIGESRRWK